MQLIDTEQYSKKLRGKMIDLENKRLLITNFNGSEQEKDLSVPANCNGFGRVRHFKYNRFTDWPANPLPILPAVNRLRLPQRDEIRAQVFQNGGCNWRCWYCYVDFKLLNGDRRFGNFLSADEMVELYLQQDSPPRLIDLTGGQPELTPEWVPWMMDALTKKNLQDKVFLWSDDNLSNDYFWRYLSDDQINSIVNYTNYARVGCFKGIDSESFELNTKARPDLFYEQFDLFKRYFDIGLDLYGYITLTSSPNTDFAYAVPKFLDKIQAIDELLPLRIIPLKIVEFHPVAQRMNDSLVEAIAGQQLAIAYWQQELEKRFSAEIRAQDITTLYAT